MKNKKNIVLALIAVIIYVVIFSLKKHLMLFRLSVKAQSGNVSIHPMLLFIIREMTIHPLISICVNTSHVIVHHAPSVQP